MTEEQKNLINFVYNQFSQFDKIAQQLREFEVHKRIHELRYRYRHCSDIKEPKEPPEETFRKGFRIAFIGNVPTLEKHSLIKSVFSNPLQLQVGAPIGTVPDVYDCFYHRSGNGIRFTLINTPSLNECIEAYRNDGRWQADAAIFIISGAVINPVEKKYLEQLSFFIDSNSLFFVQAGENRTPDSDDENLRSISEVLSIEKEKICFFSSIKNGGVDSFVSAFEEKFEDAERRLLWSVLAQMARQYKLFEERIDYDLKRSLKYKNFHDNFQRIQNQTNEKIKEINAEFTKEIEVTFPDDLHYSDVARANIKRLSDNGFTPEEMDKYVESITLRCFQVWSERLRDLLKRYLERIISEINEATGRFKYTYIFVPTNREIQAQIGGKFNVVLKNQLGEFNKDSFKSSLGAAFVRALSSGMFPLYIAFQTAGWAAAPYVLIAVALVSASTQVNYDADERQRQQQGIEAIEKDMRVIIREASQRIKLCFYKAASLSQSVSQNIFQEIEAAEEKNLIVDSHYPGIRNYDNDLIKKIRENRQKLQKALE